MCLFVLGKNRRKIECMCVRDREREQKAQTIRFQHLIYTHFNQTTANIVLIWNYHSEYGEQEWQTSLFSHESICLLYLVSPSYTCFVTLAKITKILKASLLLLLSFMLVVPFRIDINARDDRWKKKKWQEISGTTENINAIEVQCGRIWLSLCTQFLMCFSSVLTFFLQTIFLLPSPDLFGCSIHFIRNNFTQTKRDKDEVNRCRFALCTWALSLVRFSHLLVCMIRNFPFFVLWFFP